MQDKEKIDSFIERFNHLFMEAFGGSIHGETDDWEFCEIENKSIRQDRNIVDVIFIERKRLLPSLEIPVEMLYEEEGGLLKLYRERIDYIAALRESNKATCPQTDTKLSSGNPHEVIMIGFKDGEPVHDGFDSIQIRVNGEVIDPENDESWDNTVRTRRYSFPGTMNEKDVNNLLKRMEKEASDVAPRKI